MRLKSTRLALQPLEDRTNPATAAELFRAAIQVQVNQAALADFVANMSLLGDENNQFTAQQVLSNVVTQSRDAIQKFGEVADYLQAQMASNPFAAGMYAHYLATVSAASAMAQANLGNATYMGGYIGVDLPDPPAPPAPPPPPAPLPGDAGMVNSMPDVNAPQWVSRPNGIKTWDVRVGTGAPVAANDSITVFYTGWLASNGTQFDARRSPAAPVAFNLSGLIQGWQQAIPGMRNGGIRRLYIPAALAYGASGSPPNVPPDADLVFEIKMISHT